MPPEYVRRWDPDLRKEVTDLLRETLARPSRELGQHHLISRRALEIIVEAGGVRGLKVLEVGAGAGNLTEAILAAGADSVVAVEVDPRLGARLRERFAGRPVEVVVGEAPRVLRRLEFDSVASNPPFGISSRLILHLIFREVKSIGLSLQREFAHRLIAMPGEGNYGSLSVLTQARFEVKVRAILAPQVFYPRPSVEAAVLSMRPRPEVPPSDPRLLVLKQFLPHVFFKKRRLIRTPLISWLRRMGSRDPELDAEMAPVDLGSRAYELTPGDYLRLAEYLLEVVG